MNIIMSMFVILLLLAQGTSTAVFNTQNENIPAPPGSVVARDRPNDAGGSIIVTWSLSPDDDGSCTAVTEYIVSRSTSVDGDFEVLKTVACGCCLYIDNTAQDGVQYYYTVQASDGTFHSPTAMSGLVSSRAQWFHTGRVVMFVATIVMSLLVLWFIRKARKGETLYIRPIAGLEAVEDAVGRATEMGKPIMYIPGIQDMDNIQTIASMVILGRVARKAAEYETALLVPTSRSLVMSAAQETVKEAYLDAGRPDVYDANKIRYLTDDQFGYAAGVDGIMLRETPGAIFYMGAFYAESLILAETGHSTGAIQIAGTAMPSQLPFFVTACDYTLIGEELFAASAYLSKEPLLLGSLKGQDWGKAIMIAILVVGVILVSFGLTQIVSWFTTG